MKLKNIIISALSALTLVSCSMDIEYKGKDGKRMLIMNSVVEAGQQTYISVSRSAFFLDVSRTGEVLTQSDDVTVSVDINGVELDARYVDSIHGFLDNRITMEGDIISIRASHPQYGTVTATDTIPCAHDIAMSSYTKSFAGGKTLSELFGDEEEIPIRYKDIDSVLVAEIELPGRKDTTDFYVIEIHPYMVYYQWNMMTGWDTLSNDPYWMIPTSSKVLMGLTSAGSTDMAGTELDIEYDCGPTRFTFDDSYLKKGDKISVEILMNKPDTLLFPYYDYPVYGGDYDQDDEDDEDDDEEELSGRPTPVSIADLLKNQVDYLVRVKVYTISSAYYYYQKSCLDYANADITFMSEPVTILHNVKGGAGILGTAACREYDYTYTTTLK